MQQLDFGAFDIFHSAVIGIDPPAHTWHRRLVNNLFTPKSVRSWMATTASIVDRALSEAETPGQIEAVRFTPKSVRSWMATTASIVDRALSEAETPGQIEAVRELCLVPTHATMCSMLGMAAEHADEVRHYTYQFARGFGLVATED
ncbi:hypothetical protein H7K00_25135, partial [Mycolicibacterium confluentis]|nr:hypothetical protein [Mycolicibacterium confluentis]